jgi:hypothetical protein
MGQTYPFIFDYGIVQRLVKIAESSRAAVRIEAILTIAQFLLDANTEYFMIAAEAQGAFAALLDVITDGFSSQPSLFLQVIRRGLDQLAGLREHLMSIQFEQTLTKLEIMDEESSYLASLISESLQW